MSSTNAKPLPAIIYNPEEKQRETDQFSIHWIEVPKLDVHQDLSQKSQLERWVAFFDNRKLSESERNNLMTDMTINQAYSEIDRFFADKKQRDAYEARERQYRDYILNSSSFFTRTGLRIEQVCSTTKKSSLRA